MGIIAHKEKRTMTHFQPPFLNGLSHPLIQQTGPLHRGPVTMPWQLGSTPSPRAPTITQLSPPGDQMESSMDKKILMQFCENSEEINMPWSRGDYTYATNGHILAKIPRMIDIPENPKAPNLDALAFEMPKKFFPIEDIKEPKSILCEFCDGRGRDFDCCECSGVGKVRFMNNYNEYDIRCKSCEGKRVMAFCDECGGTGKEFPPVRMKFHGVTFNHYYLFILSNLPDCEIGVTSKTDASLFRFNGGTGIIMPMLEI